MAARRAPFPDRSDRAGPSGQVARGHGPSTISRQRATLAGAACGLARSARPAVTANFETANASAARRYTGKRRSDYAALKLAGLRDAPVHLAIFTATDPDEGHGLGRQTMPEMLTFSTVCAIHSLWLAARADNIGVGWVSILDPAALHATLDAPANWHFTAYLCLGIAAQPDDTPLLHRTGWQDNTVTDWHRV
ncbi:5,6-dimethylbenzimidazole synthase [Loktanella sp. SALINAS62]|uniref:5,6-dimethylbenzimidazole synthase n=1 Tax=Loktanella sp. SALINAS62 TaxID=2706124 RepID=UPI0032C4B125